jgi:hypothetical protein
LFAPACDLKFALEHFKPAVEENYLPRSSLRIHVLSDRSELNDSVGPYRKSLLYLVSRALERWHNTPLLGLVNAFDGERATDEYWHSDTVDAYVKPWQKFFWRGKIPRGFADEDGAAPGGNLQILGESAPGGGKDNKSCHGCFDNNLKIISETIMAITGEELRRPIINLDY